MVGKKTRLLLKFGVYKYLQLNDEMIFPCPTLAASCSSYEGNKRK